MSESQGRNARDESVAQAPDADAPRPVSVRASVRALSKLPEEEEQESGAAERKFTVDGVEWRATIEGESAYGSGAHSPAYLVAIRFQRVDDDKPTREVLMARGRFEALYDEELASFLEHGTKI